MKTSHRILPVLFVVSSAFFAGCQKDDSVSPDPNGKAENNNAGEFSSIENDLNGIDEAIYETEQSGSARISASACFSVEFSADTANPVPGFEDNYRKFTLSFSGGDCDSLNRSGEVIVYKSGSYLTMNYKDSVVFSGYSSNGTTLSGYRVLKVNQDLTDLTNYVLDITLNIQATLPDGRQISLQGVRQRKYVNYLTAFFAHVEITGQGQAVTADGDIIIQEIKSPVVLKSGWVWAKRIPVSGEVVYKNTNTGQSISINYGDGTLDRKAVITKANGDQVTIFIK